MPPVADLETAGADPASGAQGWGGASPGSGDSELSEANRSLAQRRQDAWFWRRHCGTDVAREVAGVRSGQVTISEAGHGSRRCDLHLVLQ